MKVYLLFEGEDNPTCVGVFSTEEKAKRFGHTDDQIEEHEVDYLAEFEHGPIYPMWIDLSTGQTMIPLSFTGIRHPTECTFLRYGDSPCGTARSPISKEHVMAFVAEKRRDWIRDHSHT